MRVPRGRSPVGAIALGVGVTVAGTLPVFLSGALAVELGRELSFGSAALGFAIAMNRASAAALAPSLGRLTDRLGATRSIRVSAVVATIASLGIALTVDRWAILVLWLMVAGAANALGLPAAYRLLSNAVRPNRLGAAFGIKQSAPPTSSMLAGVSVPLLAVTLGWRAAYFVAAGIALVVVFAAGGQPAGASRAQTDPGDPLEHRRVIWLLAGAFGLATASASTVTTFYVDAAVRAGSSQHFAGTILAVGSAAAIGVRLFAGAISDRRASGHVQLCAGLIAAGSIGIAMLAIGSPTVMAAGAVVAMAGVWGFAGVFWFAIMSAYPQAPGRVSGVVFPGALLGGTIGPTLFGLIAENANYGLAWTLSGLLAVTASATLVYGGRRLAVASAQDP